MINKMLLQYRIAPDAITKRSPAELFIGKKVRTRLDLIFLKEEESKDRCNSNKKIEKM